MTGQALAIADHVIAEAETLPAPDETTAAGLLDLASIEALRFQRDLVRIGHKRLLEAEDGNFEPTQDGYKMIRLGKETAAEVTRLSVRVAEGQFKARRDDVLERLLAAFNAGRRKQQKIPGPASSDAKNNCPPPHNRG